MHVTGFFVQCVFFILSFKCKCYFGWLFFLTIEGYVPPGTEGSYSKDKVTDIRPEAEKVSGMLNLREDLTFR